MSERNKHKLYDHEVNPPQGVWEKIAHALDESDLDHTYPAKLRDMEAEPPATVWQSIAVTLDGDRAEMKTRRLPSFWRYAAAAVILAFLAWGGLRFLNSNKKSVSEEVVKEEQPVINTTPETMPVNPTPVEEVIARESVNVTEEDRNDAALEESKKTYAKLSVPARSKVRNAADFHFALENVEPLPPVDVDPATRYITLMTPDGNFIRMSRKLSDLVCCVSGEEQDKDCVDQLKKWREKVATPSLTSSPGNFGDIMNLVKALQEM